jgi:hypothetical protein
MRFSGVLSLFKTDLLVIQALAIKRFDRNGMQTAEKPVSR